MPGLPLSLPPAAIAALVEGVDLGAVSRSESVVPAGSRFLALVQPEIRLLAPVAADLHAAGELFRHRHHQLRAERAERRVVKRLRLRPVADVDARMVDHGDPSLRTSASACREASSAIRLAAITMWSQTASMSRITSSFQKRRTFQ